MNFFIFFCVSVLVLGIRFLGLGMGAHMSRGGWKLEAKWGVFNGILGLVLCDLKVVWIFVRFFCVSVLVLVIRFLVKEMGGKRGVGAVFVCRFWRVLVGGRGLAKGSDAQE